MPNLDYEQIEGESVTFNESVCSQNDFKLGLCESSSIEFTAINIGNIKGCEIECYEELEVQHTYHELNEIMTEVWSLILTAPCSEGTALVVEGWKVRWTPRIYAQNGNTIVYAQSVMTDDDKYVFVIDDDILRQLGTIIKINWWNDTEFEHRWEVTIRYTTDIPSIYQIDLGRFVVESCDREADLSKRKIVAYSTSGIKSTCPSDKVNTVGTYYQPVDGFKFDPIRRAYTWMGGLTRSLFKSTEPLALGTSKVGEVINTISIGGKVISIVGRGYTYRARQSELCVFESANMNVEKSGVIAMMTTTLKSIVASTGQPWDDRYIKNISDAVNTTMVVTENSTPVEYIKDKQFPLYFFSSLTINVLMVSEYKFRVDDIYDSHTFTARWNSSYAYICHDDFLEYGKREKM